MQRVGRAGHWRGAIPKGPLLCTTTRDDLLEQAALLRKMIAGELDRLEVPERPTDVLMQQIVACAAPSRGKRDALYKRACAAPGRTARLLANASNEVIELLHEGIESSRGRYGAYLLRDRVGGCPAPAPRRADDRHFKRRGIPDTSLFAVMLQPENVQIATLDEHFAVDSSPRRCRAARQHQLAHPAHRYAG